ncbi:MAG TPA: cytochrome c1 [Gammaproteobacteria bacterium]|nr:cytochrome c1 [Gammaproteobacteria bacterium]
MNLRQCLTVLLLITASGISCGQDATSEVVMLKAPVDVTDFASLQRGAKLFMNECSGCHSLKYTRYDSLAKGIQITDESGKVLDKIVKDNLIFQDVPLASPIETAMRTQDGANWFGVAPPDLTLEARYRGPDWIYNYLLTFYADPSRPWGVNNLVYPDVAMPHVLLELQGEQIQTPDGLKLNRPGSMTPEQYRTAVVDLVNFLTFVSEPIQTTRKEIGAWVLVFLGVFVVFSYLLKREYWKNVHKR